MAASFHEVAQLGDEAVRTLLQDGTPLERIWAAWSLGLRAGASAAPAVREAARTAPDPGTRRHLAVVLAGLSDRGALATLAELDPDPYVRATAVQLAARLAVLDPSLWRIVDRALEEDAEVVRAAAVALPPSAPDPLRLAALARLDDPSSEVRAAAIGAFASLRPSEAQIAVRFVAEPEPELRTALLASWEEREPLEAMLVRLIDAPEARVRETVASGIARAAEPDWRSVALVVSRGFPRVDDLIFRWFHGRYERVPIEWLAEYLSRGWYRLSDELMQHLTSRADFTPEHIGPATTAEFVEWCDWAVKLHDADDGEMSLEEYLERSNDEEVREERRAVETWWGVVAALRARLTG